MGAHARLNMDDLAADFHLLLAFLGDREPLEGDLFLASVIELLNGALNDHWQVREPLVEGIHHRGLLLSHELVGLAAVRVQSNCVRVSRTEELLKDLEGVTEELVASFEGSLGVGNTLLHKLLAIFVVNFFKLGC